VVPETTVDYLVHLTCTFADNLLPPMSSKISMSEIKVFDENIPGFFSIMDFNGNQTVQGAKDTFSAKCSKGFKRFQTMNKGLIKQNNRLVNKKITKF